MKAPSDNALVDRLKEADDASIDSVYKFYFPAVASYIKRNKGTTEDAEDIFQESIIILMQKVRQPEFVLTSSLKTYLYAIAQNLWLKRLRDNRLVTVSGSPAYFQTETDTFTVDILPEVSREQKILVWISQITANCQRILKAIFFYHEPMDSLMNKMGWKNKHTADNQKYKCI